MKKILIVEDDKLIAQLERDYLAASDFEADIAFDGKEGMKAFMSKDYDLVILDVMLPEMDGFELCRIIRNEKNIPIMMITAKKDDIDKIRGLGLGADDYMVKPFSPAEMVARVKAHMRTYERLASASSSSPSEGMGTASEESIVIKDLRIFPQKRRVYIKDREINLVNKEYELLLFLAENIDVVFSKDKLFDAVWGMEAAGDTATVTVHINRIREKIEEDSSRPQYIETVWGAGYRMKG